MAKYETLEPFKDLQDKGKVYGKGKPYPQPANKKVHKDRLQQLLSSDNALGRPVIREVEDKGKTE